MHTNITQILISIAIVTVFVFLWRARRESFALVGNSWNYILLGFACVACGETSNLVLRFLVQLGGQSGSAIIPYFAVGHTLIIVGLLLTTFGVRQWLATAQILSTESAVAKERNGDLRKRISRDGMLLSTIPAALYHASGSLSDKRSETVFVNDKIEELLGYTVAEYEADPLLFIKQMHEEDQERFDKERRDFWNKDSIVVEHRFQHKAGEYRWIRRHLKQVRRENGERAEWHGCAFDITDLKQAEGRLINFLDAAPDALIAIREDGKIMMANSPAIALFGYSQTELLGTHIDAILPDESRDVADPHILDYFANGSVRILGTGTDTFARRKNGTTFPAELRLSPLGTEGVPIVICCIRDITRLRETEAQLRQAQKMQTVGQLTGGIAHDFNNMLTIIIGNLQLLERSSSNNSKLGHSVHAAMDASMRAAELVKRLLAFSRRQLLAPKNTRINDLITEIEPLLRRTISERITLKTELMEDLWLARIDPSQLENTLVNLAVNASDALDSTGRLTFETTNTVLDDSYAAQNADVRPGDYVLISVSDNGHGISKNDIPHVFEPFYSTKEVGKGSGLGLSMVYGFVKQSQGHIKVYSEEGHGTTIKIYIPRSNSTREDPVEQTLCEKEIPGGDETILLVEDDDGVREIAINLLASLGYRVLSANCAKNALKVMAEHDGIDLLFTDIVMPGDMTGVELAERALSEYPCLKVLYTSGYTDMTLFDNKLLGRDSDLLNKPYRNNELAQAIRSALDQE